MARAFADDLRCRILLAYERGGVSERELAGRFGVSRDYIKKIRKQQVQNGQKERVPQSRYGPVSRVTAAVESRSSTSTIGQSEIPIRYKPHKIAVCPCSRRWHAPCEEMVRTL